MLELVFIQGSLRGKVIPLNFQKAYFGRQPTCDYVLDGDQISRVHFGIVRRGIYNVLVDNKSTNGTFVNRVLTTEATLRAGDQVNAGTHVMLVREISAATQAGFRFVAELRASESGVQVFQADTILLGRQAICHVQLNDPAVAAVHAEMERRADGVWITDQSSGQGVYINGQRVVSQRISEGDNIRIRPFEITVRLTEDMCVLSLQQVSSEVSVSTELPADYRSVVPVPEARAGEAKPSAAIAALPVWMQDKAPIWVPTSDILPNRFRSWMLLFVLVAVLGGGAYAWAARNHAFIIPGALSKHHSPSDEQFAQLSESFQIHSQCAACHTSFTHVGDSACQICHSDLKPPQGRAADVHKGVACTACHSEHRGSGFDIARNVADGCQSAGCHPSVHDTLQSVAGHSRPKLATAVPAAVAFEAHFDDYTKNKGDALHKQHTAVLPCKACHDAEQPTSAGPKTPRATMRARCLGCHGFGSESTLRTRCYSCHFEHASDTGKIFGTVKDKNQVLRFPDAASSQASVAGSSYVPALLILFGALGAVPLLYFSAMVVSARLEQRSFRMRTAAAVGGRGVAPEREAKAPLVQLAEPILRGLRAPEPVVDPSPKTNQRPLIDLNLCVGCGACVHVCPFNVLEIVNEKAIAARLDDCTGYAACAAECPTEAIVLVTGGPMQTVELPSYDPGLETNVQGLYLAGEVTGKALIKIAINQGKTVVESILKRRPEPSAGYDLIVVGAGPAGVSTALAAIQAGLKVLVLEQGNIGNTIRTYPRQKFVMAEPVMIPVYGPLYMEDSSKETLLEKWEEIIATTGLPIHQNEKVLSIEKGPDHFVVRTSKDQYQGARVVIAIGRRGSPRKLAVPGEDSAKVTYNLSDAEAYQQKAIAVVGGGDSAIEAAVGLARAELENRVWLIHRSGDFGRAKPRNQKKLQKMIDQGRITVFFNSGVAEISDHFITVKTGGATEVLDNDFVFAMVGGESPKGFLTQCGIEFSKRALG